MEAILAFLGALVGSGIPILFAFSIFRREKLWEKKFSSYAEIIDALHKMKVNFETLFHANLQGRDLPSDYASEIYKKIDGAKLELRRASDVGELLFDRLAVTELEALFKSFDAALAKDSHFEYLDHASYAVNRCLEKIRPIARRDLKLEDSWWEMLQSAFKR